MKTKINAKVIADSRSQYARLTTLELEYPRFIHAEFMTHRVFSRNASSSRAIPIEKMIERVRTDPAMPIEWGSNQAGMQAGKEVSGIRGVHERWKEASVKAIEQAQRLEHLGLHKQIVNRVLEPFSWIKVLVTATEWDNFFKLRDHEDAQPEIRELALQMRIAMDESQPVHRSFNEWHLPYISDKERNELHNVQAAQISSARCARVSYLNHDQTEPDAIKDLALYFKLAGSEPLHASPLEHQAYAINDNQFHKNFKDWRQHRGMVELSALIG